MPTGHLPKHRTAPGIRCFVGTGVSCGVSPQEQVGPMALGDGEDNARPRPARRAAKSSRRFAEIWGRRDSQPP